jgi:hypothetical protein
MKTDDSAFRQIWKMMAADLALFPQRAQGLKW